MMYKSIRLLLGLVAGGGGLAYGVLIRANMLILQPDRLLVIPRGATLSQVQALLVEQALLDHPSSFACTAALLRYSPKATPGQYLLTSNMSNWQAVRKLRSGMQTPVKMTFVMAKDKEDWVMQCTKKTGVTYQCLMDHLNDPQRLARYGFTPENILTMLIPDTYQVYWTITADQLLAKLYTAYQYFWNPVRLRKLDRLKMTPIQVSILASMVQQETNTIEEAKRIAGVYINRIRRNMYLGSCPTVLYALRKKDGTTRNRLLYKDTHIDSPYNTYRHKGLPPGPISLPQVAMIDAVLDYIQHDYLYFVAKADLSGEHHFSASYQMHLKHAQPYKKRLYQNLAKKKGIRPNR